MAATEEINKIPLQDVRDEDTDDTDVDNENLDVEALEEGSKSTSTTVQKNKIPIFRGTRKEDVVLFVDQIKSYGLSNELEDLALIGLMDRALLDDAARWWKNLKRRGKFNAIETFEDLKHVLTSTFERCLTASQRVRAVEGLTQKDDETAKAFSDRVLDQCFESNKHDMEAYKAYGDEVFEKHVLSEASKYLLNGLKPKVRQLAETLTKGGLGTSLWRPRPRPRTP